MKSGLDNPPIQQSSPGPPSLLRSTEHQGSSPSLPPLTPAFFLCGALASTHHCLPLMLCAQSVLPTLPMELHARLNSEPPNPSCSLGAVTTAQIQPSYRRPVSLLRLGSGNLPSEFSIAARVTNLCSPTPIALAPIFWQHLIGTLPPTQSPCTSSPCMALTLWESCLHHTGPTHHYRFSVCVCTGGQEGSSVFNHLLFWASIILPCSLLTPSPTFGGEKSRPQRSHDPSNSCSLWIPLLPPTVAFPLILEAGQNPGQISPASGVRLLGFKSHF
jgi:hypothetical protein